jgi:hypothetical protein
MKSSYLCGSPTDKVLILRLLKERVLSKLDGSGYSIWMFNGLEPARVRNNSSCS